MVDEQDALALPPTGPDGALLHVDFRVTVFHIGKVDTREQTSLVRMGIVLYWTDPRMVGWTSPILPPTLWGPELWLRNAMGGVSVELEQFVVFNAEEGRLKRVLNYEATIITPMNLESFPFDLQCLSPEWASIWVADVVLACAVPPRHVPWRWLSPDPSCSDGGYRAHRTQCFCIPQVSISHWRQLDGSRFGSLPHGQSYKLVPIHRKNEGAFLMMFFQGKVL